MRINECSVKRDSPAVSNAVYLALLRYLKISKKVLKYYNKCYIKCHNKCNIFIACKLEKCYDMLVARVPTRTGKPGKMGSHFPVREF